MLITMYSFVLGEIISLQWYIIYWQSSQLKHPKRWIFYKTADHKKCYIIITKTVNLSGEPNIYLYIDRRIRCSCYFTQVYLGLSLIVSNIPWLHTKLNKKTNNKLYISVKKDSNSKTSSETLYYRIVILHDRVPNLFKFHLFLFYILATASNNYLQSNICI